ncbi:MAG: hypothetical protein ACRDAM_03460 [Casimicrobium sp.]
MKVYGVEITEEQQAAAISAMKISPFSARTVTLVLIKSGVPETTKNPRYSYSLDWCANRAADRLIRQQKKAGNIERVPGKNQWRWIGR